MVNIASLTGPRNALQTFTILNWAGQGPGKALASQKSSLSRGMCGQLHSITTLGTSVVKAQKRIVGSS